MKYYKLLKESPELEAGKILVQERSGENFKPWEDSSREMYYSEDTVTTQPNWFQEMEMKFVPKEVKLKVKSKK